MSRQTGSRMTDALLLQSIAKQFSDKGKIWKREIENVKLLSAELNRCTIQQLAKAWVNKALGDD